MGRSPKGGCDAERARSFARDVVIRLRGAGHEALFAGGCVRDELLSRTPTDYDVATSARPDAVRDLFGKRRTIAVGAAFGVITVIGPADAGQVEVATFRTDAEYTDGRHPAGVTFSTARDDALRRDFTINGMFLDPLGGEIHDYVGGRDDLTRGVVRAIGSPGLRFAEDHLRMLRAVRFAARLGFDIEPVTADAIRAHAGELMSVSPERVGEETRKMLAHPARARAAALAEEHLLDVAVFGTHDGPSRLPRLAALPESVAWTTALVAWQLERLAREAVATPRLQRAQISAFVQGVRARIMLSNQETDATDAVLSAREAILSAFAAQPVAARKRLMAAPGFDAAIAVIRGEDGPLAEAVAADADRELPDRRLPTPLLDGNALLGAGFKAGPQFKFLLDQAMDAQLEGRISTTAEALALAAKLAGELASGQAAGSRIAPRR